LFTAAVWAIQIGSPPGPCPDKTSGLHARIPEQLQFLAAHLVYGITLEGVRRLAQKAW
jgi:hypothetical protein